MSFNKIIESFSGFEFKRYLNSLTDNDIHNSLGKDKLAPGDLLNLLSDKALNFLEPMAARAKALTIQNFGRAILLYAPLYISNYCDNACVYCGFSSKNNIERRRLSLAEIEAEAEKLASFGIRHILILTGEDRARASVTYLKEAVNLLGKYFHSISIEVYPMSIGEYAELAEAGVDGLTLYQEVYDREIYKLAHPSGKKSDYFYRLDAPERGAKAGLRTINIGALLGLGEVVSEAFFTALHAKYLSDKFLNAELSVSLPRINSQGLNFEQKFRLEDKKLVQFFLAFRIFLPRAGLTLSTRESPFLRDNLIKLSATKLSAGSRPSVGGYSICENASGQFAINDNRSASEVFEAVRSAGYQPIYKDWELL